MSKILALAALMCVPVAGALGYVAHQDPAPPPFADYLLAEQNVKHVPGQDSDDWLAVAVTGPNKGGAMDVTMALAMFPNHAALEQSAQGKVAYYEFKCQNYATNGNKLSYAAKRVVRSCTSEKRTRKQAEDYMTSLLAPTPKS